MQYEVVREVVSDTPWMTPERGKVFYDHIREHKPQHILELGIGHGVGSSYMAAALHENGMGHLTCVDLIDVSYSPTAEELIERAQLGSYVSIQREKSSYTWFLKKMIEQNTSPGGVCEPIFDMCYIDGPKNWTIDGAAFFMVDKLLKADGWIIFDDYDWIYNDHSPDDRPKFDGELSDEEKSMSQVEAIFRLLVTQHPNYGNFRVDGNQWAWAQKIRSDNRTIRLTYTPDLRYIVFTRLRTLYKGVRSTK